MSTNIVSHKNIQRNWHLIDVKGKILGRAATQIANLISGKSKTNYVPYMDLGDYVVVTNAKDVKVTGKKAQQKKYVRHSGYRGGLREETFAQLNLRRPEEIVKHAVKGMLPKNKLGDRMITRLHVFAGEEHTFGRQLGEEKKDMKSGKVLGVPEETPVSDQEGAKV